MWRAPRESQGYLHPQLPSGRSRARRPLARCSGPLPLVRAYPAGTAPLARRRSHTPPSPPWASNLRAHGLAPAAAKLQARSRRCLHLLLHLCPCLPPGHPRPRRPLAPSRSLGCASPASPSQPIALAHPSLPAQGHPAPVPIATPPLPLRFARSGRRLHLHSAGPSAPAPPARPARSPRPARLVPLARLCPLHRSAACPPYPALSAPELPTRAHRRACAVFGMPRAHHRRCLHQPSHLHPCLPPGPPPRRALPRSHRRVCPAVPIRHRHSGPTPPRAPRLCRPPDSLSRADRRARSASGLYARVPADACFCTFIPACRTAARALAAQSPRSTVALAPPARPVAPCLRRLAAHSLIAHAALAVSGHPPRPWTRPRCL